MAITLIDELSDSGTIDINATKEYGNRAPMLLDMWQHEIAKSGDLYNIEEYENTDDEAIYKWTKLVVPSNLKLIKDIIFIDDDSQISTIDYKRFGNNDIYFYFTKLGTVRMLYVPIPTKITSLSQTLEIDEVTAISGSYYLAEQYAMSDQNTELAGLCKNKYQELKAESMIKEAMTPQQIVDIYGISEIR